MEIKVRTLVKVLSVTAIIVLILTILYLFYKKIQESIRVSKVKSAYSMLSEAYEKNVENKTFNWTKKSMDTNTFAKGYLNNLPVKEDCGLNSAKLCFTKQLHYLRPLGDTSWSSMSDFYKVTLQNDMNIAFKVLSPDCSFVRGRCASIFIDINGLKGPNQLGQDVFDFAIFKKELRPYEIEIVHRERCLEGNGQGCAAYILKYGNMNYKKFNKLFEKELKLKQKEMQKQQKAASKIKK